MIFGIRHLRAPFTARIAMLICTGFLIAALPGCDEDDSWNETDIAGTLPPLDFTMTRAEDGRTVTASDYRGRIVLLYFGYTFCPDVCPTTLSSVTAALDRLGGKASKAQVLFVTVDPARDDSAVLKRYADAFGARVDALRGTPAQLSALAKRYRVAYSVRPETEDRPYEVSHGSAVYVFDRSGEIRLLASSLATGEADVDGLAADLSRLIEGRFQSGWVGRLLTMIGMPA
ncbi:SCO family protein [Marivibrio halodurans]|uniref:SCO family protein n=1 Tax=Marivibrio halodurans TaxID=2039722 RepID=A0A8J7V245_9PROT|nr:SCO family protein [Marivibrio halodurans]MBP5855379.1 SCO family protein [Marivibrio halodurans]